MTVPSIFSKLLTAASNVLKSMVFGLIFIENFDYLLSINSTFFKLQAQIEMSDQLLKQF